MSAPDGLERRLTSWLEDQAPLREPEGLLDAVTLEVRRSGRVPGWAIPERWLPMQTRARLGTAPRTAIILLTLAFLVAFMTSLVLGSGSPAPTPNLPPSWGVAANGLIAHDGGADIWTMRPDGSDPHQLTSSPTMDFEPSWSPDGQLLAYWEVDVPGGSTSSSADPSGGTPSLVVIDATGHERGRVAIPGRIGYSYTTPPSWSPDSRRLVIGYEDATVSHQATLAIVSLDGMGLTPLGPGISPTWSPQGTWVAFRSEAPGARQGVWIMRPDGMEGHPVSKIWGSGYAFTSPQWSMDEQYLTFYAKSDGGHDVFVARADGSGEWPIGDALPEEYWPSISPDGLRVAFQRDLPGQNLAFNYVVTDPDGSNPVDVASPAFLPALPGVWAPDGTRLLGITTTEDDGKTIDLYQVDPAGVSKPLIVPLDNDWVNVSWQRVAVPVDADPVPSVP